MSTDSLHLADSKGRILLGKLYAGATMLAEHCEDGSIILRPAVTVPTREGWLWKNKHALELVQEGLEEASQGRHAPPVDMKAAGRLAARIKD